MKKFVVFLIFIQCGTGGIEYEKLSVIETPTSSTTTSSTTTSSTTTSSTTTSSTIFVDLEPPVWGNDPISFSKTQS